LRLAAISGYNIESMQALDMQLICMWAWTGRLTAMHRQSALVKDVREENGG
jgi:hypothetical protein